jgi:hypothetical protein
MDNHFFMTFKAVGKLTHDDYAVMVPMIESALEGVKEPTINAFIDMTELHGWELRAAWDDFKLGLKHGREFNKIALLGNKKWEELSAKVGSWFISGEMKYFEDEQDAYDWLASD